MSQHNIHLSGPLGAVLISSGFDPILSEVFVNCTGKNVGYMSPPGIRVEDIPDLVRENAHVDLPQQVLDGVQNDIADARLGATDVGRRLFQYNANGNLEQERRW